MGIDKILFGLRTERNLSQKAVADAIGISQSTIAKIEIGRNEATASTIRKLADFFDIPSDYLLGRTDDFGTIISTATKQQSVATTTLSTAAKTQLGEISSIEEQLILDFRKLPAQTQDYVIGITHNLAAGN